MAFVDQARQISDKIAGRVLSWVRTSLAILCLVKRVT
jgi:hypothetical protein